MSSSPQAILLVRPSAVQLTASICAGKHDHTVSDKRLQLSPATMAPYVHVVQRLAKVSSAMQGGRSGQRLATQLDAISRKRPSPALKPAQDPARLGLVYANAAACQALQADKLEDWVDVHISQNPLLLCQLNINRCGWLDIRLLC